LDIYAIICIFALVIQCIWHGIISAVIFLNTTNYSVTPSMQLVHIDQYVFYTVIGLFFAIHVALIIWLYVVPFKQRKIMEKKDIQYRLLMTNKNTGDANKADGRAGRVRVKTRTRVDSSHIF
jgi:H+/Cl- antiporter ClcA